eukprot:scpid54779/ scgid9082/ Adenosine deaminase; Adenosine aminohydrolase
MLQGFGRLFNRHRTVFLSTMAAASRASSSRCASSMPPFKGKVELHVHLDGAMRPETLFDVATKRGLQLPASDAVGLRKYCCYHEEDEHSLKRFLDSFDFFLPLIQGDLQAVERIAYEFCEDQAKSNILYSEPRFCPHLLATSVVWDHYVKRRYISEGQRIVDEQRPVVTPSDVVDAVCRGFDIGMADTGVMVRSILCCMTHRPDLSMEIVQLAEKFKDRGVVGIDLAGMEGAVPMDEHKPAFERARELSIHRTVHAGEIGVAKNVETAIETLHAERIGHGYAVVDNTRVYDFVKQQGTHLEACIYSSHLTGALKTFNIDHHPVKRWCEERVNCSLSTDDPGVMQCTLEEEYVRGREQEGLTHEDEVRMVFNAARSCFLPSEEKKNLLCKLRDVHGEEPK